MIKLNKLSAEIHAKNVKKGFYEEEKNTAEMLCLIHSEVSEALEALRKDRFASLKGFEANKANNTEFNANFKSNIKDTFEDEIADTMIRCFDLAGFFGIDIEKHIELKLEFNEGREKRHGKKF